MAAEFCLAMQIQERHKNWHRQIYILFTSLLSTESTFCGRAVVLWSRARVNAFLFSSSPQSQSSTTVDEISRWMMTIGAATFYTTTTDRKTELLLLGGVRHALQLLLVLPPRNIQHYYYYYYCPRSSPRPLSLCCCGVRSFDGGCCCLNHRHRGSDPSSLVPCSSVTRGSLIKKGVQLPRVL